MKFLVAFEPLLSDVPAAREALNAGCRGAVISPSSCILKSSVPKLFSTTKLSPILPIFFLPLFVCPLHINPTKTSLALLLIRTGSASSD